MFLNLPKHVLKCTHSHARIMHSAQATYKLTNARTHACARTNRHTVHSLAHFFKHAISHTQACYCSVLVSYDFSKFPVELISPFTARAGGCAPRSSILSDINSFNARVCFCPDQHSAHCAQGSKRNSNRHFAIKISKLKSWSLIIWHI